jgi:hypothetical protein
MTQTSTSHINLIGRELPPLLGVSHQRENLVL